MKNWPLILSILLLSADLICRPTYADEVYFPQSMVVITANIYPLQHVRYAQGTLSPDNRIFRIYNLDSVEAFERTISKGLPSNEKQAKLVLELRITELGRQKFEAQLLSTYQGIMTALKHQLDRYPAIIFDGNRVIYGVTDLQFALRRYSQWRLQTENKVQ